MYNYKKRFITRFKVTKTNKFINITKQFTEIKSIIEIKT